MDNEKCYYVSDTYLCPNCEEYCKFHCPCDNEVKRKYQKMKEEWEEEEKKEKEEIKRINRIITGNHRKQFESTMRFDLVNYMEEKAVNKALMEGTIPTPKGANWKAIQKKYNLPDPIRIDSVQSKVKLPPGWTIKVDKIDVRKLSIMDLLTVKLYII